MLEMIGTESPEVRTPVAPAVGELAFRIRGGDLQGRIARVRAAKCTIGAAPDCTLRLTEPGVRPLHCVIFRSDVGATVRRWSPDTLLNGRAFSDALLMVGDRLHIGPVELEVIDDAVLTRPRLQRSAAPVAPMSPPAPAIPVASLAGEIVEHLKRDFDPKQSESKLQRERKRVRQARQRVKQLKSKLTRLHESSLRLQTESERFQRELEEAQERRLDADRQLQRLAQEGMSSNATFDQMRREADDVRHRLEREIIAASEDRKRLELSLEEIRTRLAQRDTELVELRGELNQRLDDWRRERAEFQLAVELQRKRFEEVEQARETQSQQWMQEQATWQQERLSLLKSLEDKQHTEQQLEAALAELRKAVDQEQLNAAAERNALQSERDTLQQRTEELDTLQQWCDEVQARAEQAARDEAAAQNEAMRLRDRVAELEAVAEGQSFPASGGPSQENELWQQLAEARRAHKSAEAERERLRNEFERATSELQETQEQYASLRTERDELAADLTERDSRLSSQAAELESMSLQVTELGGRCQELQDLLDRHAAEQKALLQRNEQLEGQVSTPSEIPEMVARDVIQQQERIATLEAELRQKAAELIASSAQFEDASRQWAERDASWTKREQDLLRQLQCVENLARNLEENLRSATDPEAAEQANAVKLELETQLATTQEKLLAAQKQWNAQRELLEEQALSANQQVLTLEEQLSTAQQSLEISRSQLQQRDALLAQLRDEVRQQMAAWQRERDELQQELGEARRQPRQDVESPAPDSSDVEESTSDLHAEDQPIDPAYLSHAAERAKPENVAELASIPRGDDADTVGSEQSAAEPPVSVNDVLARLGAAGIWRDESADDLDAEPSGDVESAANDRTSMPIPAQQDFDAPQDADSHDLEAPVAWYSSPPEEAISPDSLTDPNDVAASCDPPIADLPPAEASQPASEEDDSIEAYMARLLKRVRGDAVANAFAVQQAVAEPKVEDTDVAAHSYVESQPEEPVNPEEFVPRSQAPEQSVDLAAMRELAIHSARQAITQSTQRRRRQATLATTGIAVGSVLGSAALFYWGWQTGNMLAYTGAVGTLTGGLIWSIRRIRRAPRPRANAAK